MKNPEQIIERVDKVVWLMYEVINARNNWSDQVYLVWFFTGNEVGYRYRIGLPNFTF